MLTLLHPWQTSLIDHRALLLLCYSPNGPHSPQNHCEQSLPSNRICQSMRTPPPTTTTNAELSMRGTLPPFILGGAELSSHWHHVLSSRMLGPRVLRHSLLSLAATSWPKMLALPWIFHLHSRQVPALLSRSSPHPTCVRSLETCPPTNRVLLVRRKGRVGCGGPCMSQQRRPSVIVTLHVSVS